MGNIIEAHDKIVAVKAIGNDMAKQYRQMMQIVLNVNVYDGRLPEESIFF